MPSDLFGADWLVTVEYTDTPLGTLKSGKESEVHLVARSAHGRTSLLARKRFLGWDRRLFRDTYVYAGGWGEGGRRESRAMKKNTRFGQEQRHRRWIANEWTNLVHLFDAGVTVPPPVELLEDGYLMAFVGDDRVAAPRLEAVVVAALLAGATLFVAGSSIFGREGVLTFESNGLFILARGRGVPRLIQPAFYDFRGYRAMYRDFLGAIRDRRAPEMSLERAMEDQRLMDRVYETAGATTS